MAVCNLLPSHHSLSDDMRDFRIRKQNKGQHPYAQDSTQFRRSDDTIENKNF